MPLVNDGISCMFVIRRNVLKLIGSGYFMRRNKRVRIKRGKQWREFWIMERHASIIVVWLCVEFVWNLLRTIFQAISAKSLWIPVQKSINTKLTAAIGLWGNNGKNPPSPKSPSPPSSPTSGSEKSPSFKARFFNNYMNQQKKESKGENDNDFTTCFDRWRS